MVYFTASVSDRNRLTPITVVAVVVDRDDEKRLNTLGIRQGSLLKERYPDRNLDVRSKVPRGSCMGLANYFQIMGAKK